MVLNHAFVDFTGRTVVIDDRALEYLMTVAVIPTVILMTTVLLFPSFVIGPTGTVVATALTFLAAPFLSALLMTMFLKLVQHGPWLFVLMISLVFCAKVVISLRLES